MKNVLKIIKVKTGRTFFKKNQHRWIEQGAREIGTYNAVQTARRTFSNIRGGVLKILQVSQRLFSFLTANKDKTF